MAKRKRRPEKARGAADLDPELPPGATFRGPDGLLAGAFADNALSLDVPRRMGGMILTAEEGKALRSDPDLARKAFNSVLDFSDTWGHRILAEHGIQLPSQQVAPQSIEEIKGQLEAFVRARRESEPHSALALTITTMDESSRVRRLLERLEQLHDSAVCTDDREVINRAIGFATWIGLAAFEMGMSQLFAQFQRYLANDAARGRGTHRSAARGGRERAARARAAVRDRDRWIREQCEEKSAPDRSDRQVARIVAQLLEGEAPVRGWRAVKVDQVRKIMAIEPAT